MAESDLPARLRERLEHFGLAVSSAQCHQLAAYIGLLTKWNKTVNLTGLSLDPLSDEAVDRLLVEPFLAAKIVADSDQTLLDLGSGGGSPAIPLKLAVPRLRLTMVESRTRKSAFLRDAVRLLRLAETKVETVRIEELARLSPQPADLVSIRAVRLDFANWDPLTTLVALGGRLLWFRSAGTSLGESSQGFALESEQSLIPGNNSELAVFRRIA